MKYSGKPIIFFVFVGLCATFHAGAQSWINESVREFEEFRLRQLQTVQQDGVISAFTSDGCSAGQSLSWEMMAQMLPEFEKHFKDQPPWASCCVAHDKRYWRGRTEDGYSLRKKADEELKQCVVASGEDLATDLSIELSVPEQQVRQAFVLTSELMYRAVRLGGQPCSLLPWRWGYGWNSCAFASASDIPDHFSSLKSDEHITLFNSAGWLDVDKTHWQIPIHAWVYEPQHSQVRAAAFAAILDSAYDLTVTSENEENFQRRSNLLIADNERGKTLVIRLAGQDFTLPPSAQNGHVATTLNLPLEVASAFSDQGRLQFIAVLPNADNRRYVGQVKLVPQQGISVISDIDDTVKISNVTDRGKLLASTFFNDFEEVPRMAELYRRLAEQDISIHFVSSSPWQLYDPLQDFLRSSGFPWATMHLKAVRFRDETLRDLFKKGTETKPAQIEPILQRYPARRFILIGDSGEQDPEVYGDIARRYSDQVYRILIRNVDGSTTTDSRYLEAFSDIAQHQWRLFDDPREISVTDLLAQ